MSSNGRTAVSAELGVGLVGPEHTIVPLMASLSYSCHDPYAVTIAFHVGTDEPVEWALARDRGRPEAFASQIKTMRTNGVITTPRLMAGAPRRARSPR